MAWGLGVDGRPAAGLQSPHRAPKALSGSCDARDGERIRSRGLSRPGWREIAGTLGQLQAGRQAGNGMACSRAKARLNWVSQGQRRGRCKVRRRAERVIRPTRAKTRRLESYRRYFLSGWAQQDHDGLLPGVLFVFETPGSEDAFLHAADRLNGPPIITSNVETLAERGILGNSWRESPPASSSDGLNRTDRVQLRSLYPVA